MKQIDVKSFSKYLFIGLFLAVIYLSYLVVKPFLVTIITSLVIAYIFYPLYKYIKKAFRNPTLSAFIASFLIILLISLPFILLLQSATQEAGYFYVRAKQKIATGGLFKISCVGDEGFQRPRGASGLYLLCFAFFYPDAGETPGGSLKGLVHVEERHFFYFSDQCDCHSFCCLEIHRCSGETH